MRPARLAVRVARRARICLLRGDLEMAVMLIVAAGSQLGRAARPRDGEVFPSAYLRASGVVHHVATQVAAVAGARRAVMVEARTAEAVQ